MQTIQETRTKNVQDQLVQENKIEKLQDQFATSDESTPGKLADGILKFDASGNCILEVSASDNC